MHRFCKHALVVAAISLTIANAARADTAPPANPPPTSPTPQSASNITSFNRFAWGGIGYYGVRYSYSVDGFGSVSATDGSFGIQVGAALGFLDLAPGLHLQGWASVAPVFGSGTYFPINIGAGVTYDKLPVALFGGLGFTIMPNSPQSVAVGLDINLMGIYPLPMVLKNLGAMVQLQFDILDENLFVWNFVFGATYSF